MTKLNLGCSDQLLPDYINVDIVEPCDVRTNLMFPWPWIDNSIDEIRAKDIIEHLPNKIFTMNEMYRVLKPGGVTHITVPDASRGEGAHCDPTHRSYWVLSSFLYHVENTPEWRRYHKSYGIEGAFRKINWGRRKRPTSLGLGDTVHILEVTLTK